jgi:hypothetical protein
MSGGRFVVGAAISGAVVRVAGAGETATGATATVPGAGVFPFSVESRHLAREFLDSLQKHVIIRRLANARQSGRGNSLSDAVCTIGHSVQLDPWMAGKISLYFGSSQLIQITCRK